MRKIALILMLISLSSVASASVLIRPAFTYTIDKTSQSSTTTVTRRLIDVTLGYQFEGSNWALLGTYADENRKNDNGGSTTNEDRTSYGVGGGWFSSEASGPYIDGIYYLSSEDDDNGTTYKGDGWQIDLGYTFAVSAVTLGPQLSYRDFKYTTANGTSLSPKKEQANLDPMIVFMYKF